MTHTSCYEYSIKTPDDGQYFCLKHVELYIKIKLRNSTSYWLLLYKCIMMYSPQNVKFTLVYSFFMFCSLRLDVLISPWQYNPLKTLNSRTVVMAMLPRCCLLWNQISVYTNSLFKLEHIECKCIESVTCSWNKEENYDCKLKHN
jgi:hypothetical protein